MKPVYLKNVIPSEAAEGSGLAERNLLFLCEAPRTLRLCVIFNSLLLYFPYFFTRQ
jgi:hypothetical protein